MLPVESRVGTVKAHSIILEVTLTKQKNLFVLAKTDKNKIDKKLKSMPELEESSQDEEEEDKEDEEDEDEGRSKSAVRKPGKSWWKDMLEEEEENVSKRKSKRGAT